MNDHEFNSAANELVARVKAYVKLTVDAFCTDEEHVFSQSIFTQTQDLLLDISNFNGICSTELKMGHEFIGPLYAIDMNKFKEIAKQIQFEFVHVKGHHRTKDDTTRIMQACIALPPIYRDHMFAAALAKYIVCESRPLCCYIISANKSYGWDAFCNKYHSALTVNVN